MSNNSVFALSGVVTQCMPNATFRVEFDNGKTAICTISGKIRKNNINIVLYDRVDVEVSVYDVSRGRIVFRHRK